MPEQKRGDSSGENQEDVSKGERKDLGATITIDLKRLWDPGDAAGSLDAVFQYVAEDAIKAIGWYLKSKRTKKIGARVLRFAAIVFVAIAGILPVLLEMLPEDSRFSIPAASASILAGLAAAMIALDRFFGFSSGWVRYISAEMRIRRILEEFRIDWAMEKSAWKDGTPDADQVRGMLERARAFNMQVNAIVQDETNAWITEFKANVKEIDELVKTRAEAARLGGLNVVVSNGDECKGGWELYIDGRSVRSYMGKTAAIRDLMPGSHTVRAEGVINDSQKQSEAVVSVPAGGIGSVELTLNGQR
jgi:hypothetical protein